MSKKKLTLEDLKALGNGIGGIAAAATKIDDRKVDDAEGASSGKHGSEYTGTEKDIYMVGPKGSSVDLKKK
jgi:hypothetical protein